MKVGDAVRFTDELRQEHTALLTAVHGFPDDLHPAVNLVYVSADESKTDPYGRQVDRRTSVVHRSKQSAAGMFWA